jgi:hypothetical protein
MMTVISTGLKAPTRDRCLASVACQLEVDFHHVYLDAGLQTPPLSHFQNLINVIEALPDDRIVAAVDGDDWLAHPHALKTVQMAHLAGAWLTYGSFQFADGRPGFASAYLPDENPRTARWKATHLKTFRAGLFKRIRHADLQLDGEFLPHGRDLAMMFPMIEMAGPRAVFISDVLYVYNFSTSTEFTGDEAMRADEARMVKHVRALPPYERLSSL